MTEWGKERDPASSLERSVAELRLRAVELSFRRSRGFPSGPTACGLRRGNPRSYYKATFNVSERNVQRGRSSSPAGRWWPLWPP